MPKTKLYIRHKKLNSKGEAGIYIRYSHADRACDFSTGERIDPKFWDFENRLVRKSYKGFTSLNNYLLKKKMEVEELRLNLQTKGINPTIDTVRKEYKKLYEESHDEPQQSNFILDQWDNFIAYQRDIRRITKDTIKQYTATKKKLEQFEEYTNTRLTLDKIDIDFSEQFIFFLYSQYNCSSNTVGGKIKHIKAFMNWAYSKGVTTNAKYKEFKKPSNDSTVVALTQEQLDTLVNLDLSGEPRLEKVRDLFVFGCSTGLRFSDYSKVKPANIKNGYIVINTEKTDAEVRIPLNDYSKRILTKYNSVLPTISNVNMNKFLKEIGIRAEFFEQCEVAIYRGGVKQKLYKPLYSLITSHTARRTFATQSLTRGLGMFDTMRLTGHRDVRSFQRYVHLGETRLQQEVHKAWNTLSINNTDNSKQ